MIFIYFAAAYTKKKVAIDIGMNKYQSNQVLVTFYVEIQEKKGHIYVLKINLNLSKQSRLLNEVNN
jgi:hypothetical protein